MTPKFITKMFLALLIMASQSCNILRKSSKEAQSFQQVSSELSQAKLIANRSVQTNQHFLDWRSDSMHRNDAIMIWPKGKFSFSIKNGFEGEAEKIILKSSLIGSNVHLTVKDSLVHAKEQRNAGLLYKSIEQMKAKASVNSKRPSFLILLIVAIIIAIAFLLYRYLSK